MYFSCHRLYDNVHSFVVNIRIFTSVGFFCIVLHEKSSRQEQSIHSSRGQKKNLHSARSVKSLLLIQILTHSIKSFHLYTVTYYTHLGCLHNVFSRASVPACALPVNSLHSNPCQGTQSLECIKSAVLGQAPGLDLSIYHAFLNPPKENELSLQMS